MLRRQLICLIVFLLPYAANAESYNFQVLLNDKPIGEHRVTVIDAGNGEKRVQGHARYQVKILGFVVFDYDHQHQEVWQAGCLKSLRSTTYSQDKTSTLDVQHGPDALTVVQDDVSSIIEHNAPNCLWSYAYWETGLQQQTALINGQTGEITSVSFTPTKDLSTTRVQLQTAEQKLDIAYDALGRWSGLEVKLNQKRRLTYRPI